MAELDVDSVLWLSWTWSCVLCVELDVYSVLWMS